MWLLVVLKLPSQILLWFSIESLMGFCQIIKIVPKIGLPPHNSIHAMNSAAHVVQKIFLNDSQEKFEKPINS